MLGLVEVLLRDGMVSVLVVEVLMNSRMSRVVLEEVRRNGPHRG